LWGVWEANRRSNGEFSYCTIFGCCAFGQWLVVAER
jgi:hypothetical protein